MESNLTKSTLQRVLQKGMHQGGRPTLTRTRRALLMQALLLVLGVLSGCYSPYYARGDYHPTYPYSYGYSPYGYRHHGFGYYGHGGHYGHHRYYRH